MKVLRLFRPWMVTAYSGALYPRAADQRFTLPSVTLYAASAPTRKPSRPRTVSVVKVGPLKRGEQREDVSRRRLCDTTPYMEDVEGGTGVHSALFVDGVEDCTFGVLLGQQGSM